MMLALLLAQASALDAERAFAADAQKIGQWTAFRKWVDDDAVMFDPQPVEAKAWLKDRRDPARAVRWWPIASYTSCDGVMAANTGAWRRPDGSIGYFTTIWFRGTDGRWRWQLDHGDTLSTPRAVPRDPVTRRAVCTRPDLAEPPVAAEPGARTNWGAAPDDTLRVRYSVGRDGGRVVIVKLWNGNDFDTVIADQVPPPKP